VDLRPVTTMVGTEQRDPPVVYVGRHVEASRNYLGGQSLTRLRFSEERAIASVHLNGERESRILPALSPSFTGAQLYAER